MEKYVRTGAVLLVCIYFWHIARSYTEWHFIDGVDLIFHEAGHTIFSFFGEFLHVLMGSGFQILVPLFFSLYFYLHNQKISGGLTLLWLGQNFLNVAVYAADSIKMDLPLLGGDGIGHDWNYLLTRTDLLSHTELVAGIIYSIGICVLFLGTLLSLYFAWNKEQKTF